MLYSYRIISGVGPPHAGEEELDVYGRCFRMNDDNVPWVIAVLIGSISIAHAKWWLAYAISS